MTEQQADSRPVAVFDSGIGGISVLKELVKQMPHEDFLYYGDSLHAPYGTRTLEEVRALTLSHAKELFDAGAKALVVACNTATSAAVRILRERYPQIPIVGIEPALKPAVEWKQQPRVLVMATPMTIREEKFHQLMARYQDQATVIPLPCPGLMEFIERGDLTGEDLREYLNRLLAEYQKKPVDAVVLGCTHYPFVRDMIQECLKDARIFDGGEGTAREMKRRLTEAELLSANETEGSVTFQNSAMTPEKLLLCERLLNY